MLVRDRLFMGGEWVGAAGRGWSELVDPSTGEVFGRVVEGDATDVDRAVTAASAALAGWSATEPGERAALLRRLSAGLIARMAEVGDLVARQIGMPVSQAALIQGGAPAYVAGAFADICESYAFEAREGPSLLLRRPVGVVGAISSWNWPLYVAVSKAAAALAAGCTVVLKPSEVAPLTELLLAEVAAESGLPPGVLNVVCGTGPVAGEALVAHPGVSKLSFTGSTRTGRRVAELAGRSLTPLVAELGGKSAAVVLDDADLEEAVQATVRQAFLNSGQTCLAWSRLLVPAGSHGEAARMAARMAAKVASGLVVGDPFDPATDLGPLSSAALRERVWAFVSGAEEEGAVIECGGVGAPPALDRGFYARPTVLSGVTAEMTVAREEVFGPVLAVMAYEGGDDGAVELANSTDYGLHGAVFSADRGRALAVARRLRTGQVDLGGAGYNVRAPIGGFGLSGWGRELGVAGMEEFLAISSIQLPHLQ